jgi:hypothetical protein
MHWLDFRGPDQDALFGGLQKNIIRKQPCQFWRERDRRILSSAGIYVIYASDVLHFFNLQNARFKIKYRLKIFWLSGEKPQIFSSLYVRFRAIAISGLNKIIND